MRGSGTITRSDAYWPLDMSQAVDLLAYNKQPDAIAVVMASAHRTLLDASELAPLRQLAEARLWGEVAFAALVLTLQFVF